MSINTVSNLNNVFLNNSNQNISKVKPLGYKVSLKATNSKHFNFTQNVEQKPSFLNYLKSSINNTNNSIINSEKLQQQLVIDPESVSIDEVTIAAKEAEITLNLTKTILNKLISGYKDLINIR